MSGIPLQFVALFCFMFIALIAFNTLVARRRQKREGTLGLRFPWYQQTTILTIVEYVLLASIFFLNVGISYHAIPANLYNVVFPAFIILVFASGLLAGYIVFLLFRRTSLTRKYQQVQSQQTSNEPVQNAKMLSPQERAAYAERRRDRRQKAATARRRKAGKS